ncbi:transporter substrate-binding domain-containing protein [Globicatella sulfidifaciens]|uniref:transporter substrate-binding domain-containing protein n=1 Tax=Globicatella sulfidifaciens TaxID=136093 RepID=UPI00288DB66E|nr:transporter substrate-binding domain-containing protein [Globicatella sulfidifaciens]MDT2768120.1 transporter substrate-binding domain-containing protein [Globicatella sulfidifaciens]
MKSYKKHSKTIAYLLFIAIIAIFLLVFNQAASKSLTKDVAERLSGKDQTILWGVKNDTKLFGYYNVETQEIEGFDIDIAKELTRRITGDAENARFIEVTSKTRIPLLKNGNIDAIIATMTITDARKKVVDFSDVYFAAGQSLLVANDANINSVKDLTAEHTVITVKGSTSAKNIREAAPAANIIELETYADGFTALKAGQGDAVTTDNAILLGLLVGNDGYRVVSENFTDEPYGIAVNKQQEGFLSQINQHLADMQVDGTYDQIYNKWFGEVLAKGAE